MTKASDLSTESDEALVLLFAEFSIRAYKAKEDAEHQNDEDIDGINRAIRRGWAVRDELKRRGNAARLKLMTLYDHPNVQVKLNAATATLAVAPLEARQMIEAIASWRHFPQSGEAGMRIWALDEGIFKPT